jgi:hypothetical protein
MPTPYFLTGFEQGVLSINGGGICAAITGSPAIQSSVKRTGSYALQYLVSGSAATSYVSYNVTASPTVFVGKIYFRWNTALSTATRILRFLVVAGSSGAIYFDPSDATIYPYISTAGSKSAALAQNTWYEIDWKFDVSTGTSTLDVQLNKVAITQKTYSQTATSVNGLYVGMSTSATGEIYFDDMYLSVTSGDYPIGGSTNRFEAAILKPNADGTHNAGTNVIEANDGTDIGTTTAYDKINSIPPSNTTYIKQVATGTGNYFEVTLEDMPAGKTPIGVLGGLAYMSSGTLTNQFATGVMDGATFRDIYGNPTTRADYSESSLFYKTAIISLASMNESSVNAMKIRGGYSNDISPVPYCVDVWVEVGYLVPLTITGDVNQNTETDAAQSVGKQKNKAVGQPSETDSVQAVGKQKAKAAGLNSETDSALSISRQKRLTLGLAVETDSVQAIARQKILAVGLNSEIDTSQTVAPAKMGAVGQASETDEAQVIGRAKIGAVAQVSETDEAQTIIRIISQIVESVGQVTEADEAQAFGRQKAAAIGLNTEANEAQAVGAQKVKTIGLNVEADEAQAVTSQKAQAVGLNSETDEAQAVSSQKIKTIGLNVEADEAQAVGRVKVRALGLAEETDEAQLIQTGSMVVLGLCQESDEALSIRAVKVLLVNPASEEDIAQVITSQKVVIIGQATETDEGFSMQAAKMMLINQAAEDDLAQALFPAKRVMIGQAFEVDAVLAFTSPGFTVEFTVIPASASVLVGMTTHDQAQADKSAQMVGINAERLEGVNVRQL